MKLFLTVSGIGDRLVESRTSTTVAELAAVLEPWRTGDTSRTLQVQRSAAILAPDAPLGEVDLRSGDRVTVVDIESATSLDRGPDPSAEPSAALVMLTGPLAGDVIQLPAGTSTVGRAASNDLVLADPGISRRHAYVTVDASAVVVTDRGSTNRVQIEGLPIDGPTAVRSGQRILLGQSWAIVEHQGVPTAPVGGRIPFDRPPRLVTPFAGRTFTVTPPPEEDPAPRRRLRTRLGDRQSGRSANGGLDATLASLNLARREEREARGVESPSIDEVVLGVRSRTRLWERRIADHDVLDVRLGLAELASRHRVEVEPGGPPEFRRRVDRLPQTYATIDGVPATVDLGRPGGLTLRGPLDRTRPVAASVIGQLVGLNAPDQLGVLVCGDGEAMAAWDWLKWLPHLMGPDTGKGWTGTETVEAVEALLNADPADDDPTDATGRPPFVLVVIDGADPAVNGSGPDLIRRLLTEGAMRGVHPLVVERAAEPIDEVEACLLLDGVTGRLTMPGHSVDVVDPVAVETLGKEAAVDLARLLAPIVSGRPPAPVAEDDAPALTITPLALGPDSTDPGRGPEPPLDLFDLPSVDGDARLVLGRARMSDELETILAFNPARDGTLGLIGPAGDDRTGCLLTVGTAVARVNGPADERPALYGFGSGGGLDGLSALSVVAGVVDDDPDDAMERLAEIETLMGDRLLTFELAGVDDLAGFREARPEVPLRRWMVLIDGLGHLAGLLEPTHPGRTREVVGQLLEIGSSLGLHLVFTAESRDEIDPLLVSKVGRWLELDTSPDATQSGRVLLEGVEVRFAAPGGAWQLDKIDRAIAELAARDLAAAESPTDVTSGSRRRRRPIAG